MDLVLRDALVVDGTGGPSYRADVAVDGGRISEIHREGSPAPPHRRPHGRRRRARALPRLHRHARPQRSGAAARPGPQREGGTGRHARSPGPGRPVVRPGRRPYARGGPALHRRLERRRLRHRLRLAHGRRLSGPPGPQLRRPGHRRQRRLPHPAGHGPDVRGRLGGPPGLRSRTGPDEGAGGPGDAGGRGRHVVRSDLHPGDVRGRRRTHRAVPGGGPPRRLLLPAPPQLRAGRWRRTRRWCSWRSTPAAPSISPTPP